ncbi:hypothetical protein C8R46DRAFT_1040416 [Mycena filopes]|nr:hypothetical protein C8R46DRAFT_1040416 [Mycena filopes]
MDPSAHRRFTITNVSWPDARFFVPHGGLSNFLEDNLRFKVFLVASAVFTDAFASRTVERLPLTHITALRLRVLDIVRHMFFASQIRHNEALAAYGPVPVPAASAWMFHLIQALLHVVGFKGDDELTPPFVLGDEALPEGELARSQASFLLAGAIHSYVEECAAGGSPLLDYTTFDPSGRVSRCFGGRIAPEDLVPLVADDGMGDGEEPSMEPRTRSVSRVSERPRQSELSSRLSSPEGFDEAEFVADAAGLIAAVDAVHQVALQQAPTRCSVREVAHHIDSKLATLSGLPPREFLVFRGDGGLSDSSYDSLPSLRTMSNSDDSLSP